MNEEIRSFKEAIEQCQKAALAKILGAPQKIQTEGISFHRLDEDNSCIVTAEGYGEGKRLLHYTIALSMVKGVRTWIPKIATVYCGVLGKDVPDNEVPETFSEFVCVNGHADTLQKIS